MPYASQSAYVAMSVAYSVPSVPLKVGWPSLFIVIDSMRNCSAFCTVGPNSLDAGVSPWARYARIARPVLEIGDGNQLPFGFWVFFSHLRAFSTAASVFGSPYMLPPAVMRPMEPGVREPVIDFMVTGDLMSATLSWAAGLTVTGSLTGVA